jgi:hypothetical protein
MRINRLSMPDVFDTIVSDLCREIIEAKNDPTEFEACIEDLSEVLQERIVVLRSRQHASPKQQNIVVIPCGWSKYIHH